MRPFLIVLLFFSYAILFGQNPDRQFEVANKSYEIKQYAVAIEQYESILESGYQSAELYYNLGNAYYRSGELGHAILNYERALRLQDADENIQHNLKIARAEVKTELDELPTFFLSELWRDMQSSASSNVWASLFLILLFLGAAGWILWQMGKERTHRKWGFSSGIVLLLLALFTFLLALGSYQTEQHSGQAIVLEEAVKLRKGASEESGEMLVLAEGVKVRLLNNVIREWQKVRLSNGQEGWLLTKVVEEI